VDRLDGSRQAKSRLRAILRTLAGETDIPQACRDLGICQSRFHKLRSDVLQRTLEGLEPKSRGRPRQRDGPGQAEIEGLRAQVQLLERQLQAARIREEVAFLIPQSTFIAKAVSRQSGRKKGRIARNPESDASPGT
jgi:transposase-like protein